jgi:hypothetical protein
MITWPDVILDLIWFALLVAALVLARRMARRGRRK